MQGPSLKNGLMPAASDWWDEISRRLRDAASQTRRAKTGRRKNVNFAGRINRVSATNSGRSGGVRYASSKQTVRIVQDGKVTHEETETQTESD
jgi:hypothetical protein